MLCFCRIDPFGTFGAGTVVAATDGDGVFQGFCVEGCKFGAFEFMSEDTAGDFLETTFWWKLVFILNGCCDELGEAGEAVAMIARY